MLNLIESRPISLSHMYVKIDCKHIMLISPSQSASGAVEVEPSLGQLEGTAGDSTVPMVSEMQDAGLQEASSLELLDASVSGHTPREREPRAATLPADPLSPKAVLQEGMLGRKHDLEAAGKKASNRCRHSQPYRAWLLLLWLGLKWLICVELMLHILAVILYSLR